MFRARPAGRASNRAERDSRLRIASGKGVDHIGWAVHLPARCATQVLPKQAAVAKPSSEGGAAV